jgi:hypothetical protein
MRPDGTPSVVALAAGEDEEWRGGSALVLAVIVLAGLLRTLLLWPFSLVAHRVRKP